MMLFFFLAGKDDLMSPKFALDLVTTMQRRELQNSVRFEVFTAVTMKNGVFWDVTLCGSSKNRRFEGT
jgi:hypothetical protein